MVQDDGPRTIGSLRHSGTTQQIVSPKLPDALSGLIGGQTYLAYLLLGWFFQLVFSFSYPYPGITGFGFIARGLYSFCVLWFVGSSGYFLGMMAGFLFGFPKALADEPSADPSLASPRAGPRRTRDNTNLEDISDWLTKIIIGLGLANFRQLISYIDKFGTFVGIAITKDTSPGTGAYVVAIASALYGFACGFLFFYIWSRSELARVLNQSQVS